MSKFERHPLSAAFPSFSDADLDALVEDIRSFGQRESGLLLDGMILDGWNRYQACERLGIDFNYVEFSDEYPDTDPLAFVMSKNLHRRHMTKEQRAAAVVACREWAKDGTPNLATVARLATIKDMAHEADVSERTISRAKVAHEAGLGGAVVSGEMTLRQAEQAAKAQRQYNGGDSDKHESAAEVAARTDAIAVKPPFRTDAAEQSSPKAARANAVNSEVEDLRNQLSEARDLVDDLQHTAAELQAEVEGYRASDRGEGEKALVEANKRALKLEGEIRRLESIRDDWMNKYNEAAREAKKWRRQAERGHE